jgi:hypothetical protein
MNSLFLYNASQLLIIFSWIFCAVAHYMNVHLLFRCQFVKQAESSISCTTTSRHKTDVSTPIQTPPRKHEPTLLIVLYSLFLRLNSTFAFHQGSARCEIMTCLSISRLRSLLSTFIPRVLSPGNPRETVLFGGPDLKRSSTLGSTRSDISMMSEEQSILTTASSSCVPAKSLVPQRLHVSAPLFHVHASL